MKTLIVGLGNPVLGDDGVGWRVAESVEKSLAEHTGGCPPADVERLALGGLSLMEHLIGYDRAILIDAARLNLGPLGSVHQFPLEVLPDHSAGHLASTHDTSLQNALQVGRSLGEKLPSEITVVAIEADVRYEFSEQLTPPVAEAVSPAAHIVLNLLNCYNE
ncbi:MAG: hydrogenase maturation protease [Chloroflexi bacterium]|nr:hydrogenase maturation protease [Chloroflexota bacterium]